jgi:hypothetical protein
LRINCIFAFILKNNTKISSILTAFLAVIILFAASFSGAVHNNTFEQKSKPKTEKSAESSKTADNHYFTKASIEAVFSPIIPAFNCEAVVFLATEFRFQKLELFYNFIQIFERKPIQEILFEHLVAPNAP